MSAHLDPEEINALMSAVDEGRVADPRTEAPVAIPYDLTSQDRIIRGQMPTLDSINEQTASLVAMGISGRTRLISSAMTAPSRRPRWYSSTMASTDVDMKSRRAS